MEPQVRPLIGNEFLQPALHRPRRQPVGDRGVVANAHDLGGQQHEHLEAQAYQPAGKDE